MAIEAELLCHPIEWNTSGQLGFSLDQVAKTSDLFD